MFFTYDIVLYQSAGCNDQQMSKTRTETET